MLGDIKYNTTAKWFDKKQHSRKAHGTWKEVDVKECEVKKKHPGKEVDSLSGSDAAVIIVQKNKEVMSAIDSQCR